MAAAPPPPKGKKLPYFPIEYIYNYFEEQIKKDIGLGGAYKNWLQVDNALNRVSNLEKPLYQKIIKSLGIINIIGDKNNCPPNSKTLKLFLNIQGEVVDEFEQAVLWLCNNKVLYQKITLVGKKVISSVKIHYTLLLPQ